MKTKWLFVIQLGIVITLMSCVTTMKIPYDKMQVDLSYSGSKSIALSIYDRREMVVDGSRKPDFVGYCRSGTGMPYPIGTENGKTFVEVLQETISKSFTNKGFSVKIIPSSYKDSLADIKTKLIGSSNDRLIIIKLKKLHSDYWSMKNYWFYDLDVFIFDKNGTVLLTKNYNSKEVMNCGNNWGMGKYKEYNPKYLETQIKSMLNDQELVGVLK